MNEFVPDGGGQQIDIAFVQEQFRQDDDWLMKTDRDGNRQRFRTKHFYRTGGNREIVFAALNDLGEPVVRLQLYGHAADVSRSVPGLDQLTDAIKDETEVDCEQRESESLIQFECR